MAGPGGQRAFRYDRAATVHYAGTWWNRHNPGFPALADDCTNFASQALHAGGWPQVGSRQRNAGWWIAPGRSGSGAHRENWSFSWTVANALRAFWLDTGRGRAVADPGELSPGDLLFYDWNGDGRFSHAAVVVDMGPSGPLVAAHSFPAYGVFWAYRHSPAWSPRTRYSLVRVAGSG